MTETTARERTLELLASVGGAAGPIDRATRLDEAGLDSLALAEVGAALRADLGIDLEDVDLGPEDAVAELLDRVPAAAAGPRPTLPRSNGRVQRFAAAAAGPGLRWWFRLRVLGRAHVPPAGPVVLAMNHESALDIPLLAVAMRRRITFMAKTELFKNGFVTSSLNLLGAFPVDRRRYDLRAIDVATGVLERGGVLGMYPEGTRSPGHLLPFLDGAAWFALRAGAPLVPCALHGTEQALQARRPRRAAVVIEFLPPVVVERVDDPVARRKRAGEVTVELRSRIASALAARPHVSGARS